MTRDDPSLRLRLLNVHTSASNGGFYQTVEFLVSTDSQLEVTWSDALHLEILTRIASQLQDLHTTQPQHYHHSIGNFGKAR